MRVGPGWGRPSASASWSCSLDVVDVAAAGRAGAPREHAGAVAEDHLLADPVGHLVRRGRQVGVEVDDRLDGDLGAGVGAPVLDLVEEHQPLAFLHPAGRTEHRGQPVEGGVEVGVEHDLAGGGQPVGVTGASGALGVEVERGLGASEVTEGLRAAGGQRLARAERLPRCGAVGECAVEVEGVGDVELGLHPHRAGEVHVIGVDRGVARVDVEVAVLRIRSRVDRCEVEAADRLGDEPVQLRRPDPTGDGGDLRVDERRCFAGQRGGGVDGGLRDRTRPPRRDPAGLDLRPQPRESVAQLEGVADELLRRDRRDPEDRTELGQAELRDQRRTLTRDGLLVLAAGDREGCAPSGSTPAGAGRPTALRGRAGGPPRRPRARARP